MITYYYPRTIKAITVALLDMFNDIRVVKYDKYGNPLSEKTVPITFGPTEKYHQDRTENHYFDSKNVEHNNRYYLQLPRIALTPVGVAYDSERATGVNEWRHWFAESLDLTESQIDDMVSDYQPTPYTFSYTVDIKNDSMDYLSQILENILPYFNPTLMLRVKEFSFLDVERDLPVTIDGVGYDFIQDETAPDTRFVNATLNLTVKGYMYRPIATTKVIKVINSKYIKMDTGTFLDGYQTSGFITSAGIPLDISAIPHAGEFISSGHYNNVKEFDWYKSYMSEPTSATISNDDGINIQDFLPNGVEIL